MKNSHLGKNKCRRLLLLCLEVRLYLSNQKIILPTQKSSYEPGFEFHAKYTVLAEGCRGHLGKEIITRYALDKDCDPQHYGIGIKEVWEIPQEQHREGLVLHSVGYPMVGASYAGSSGGFLYHIENNQVSLGLIVDLSYSNPHISPFNEFQK